MKGSSVKTKILLWLVDNMKKAQIINAKHGKLK